jgi:hypothetical protein
MGGRGGAARAACSAPSSAAAAAVKAAVFNRSRRAKPMGALSSSAMVMALFLFLAPGIKLTKSSV